ncbi:MAG: YfhO family protein [Patescibacteria group bacterium]
MNPKRADGFAAFFFVLLVGVFFWQTVFQGKLPVPSDTLVGLYHPWRDLYRDTNPRGVPFKNFLITDPVRQQIPWRKIVIDQWKEGIIPTWNPFNFLGNPLLANIQSAVLYPLNILFFVFPFINAWTILIVLQPLLAGLFMYWYLRGRGLLPVAGLLGAIAWSFSGFNIAWLTWGTIGHVALWLPLTLLAVDKLLVWVSFPRRRESIFKPSKTGSPIRSGMTNINQFRALFLWSIVFIVSLVFQFFAGHVQISLYFILIVIAYSTIRIFQTKDRKHIFLLFILLVSLVACITALQWMPLLDWIRQSSRVLESAVWNKEGWFIPWAHVVQFVAPDFFGNPTTLNYWGQWNYGEFIGYIGVLPLVFALMAFMPSTLKVHRFWIGILVVTMLFSFPTPISMVPFALNIPILSVLQPTRLLFVIDFALAVLAAYGCQEFLVNRKERRGLWSIALVGVIVLMLWGIIAASRFGLLDASLRASLEVSARNLVMPTVLLFFSGLFLVCYNYLKHIPVLKIIIPWGVVALVVFDVFRFGWKFTPFTPREYFFPETKIITFLKEQPQPFRIMSVDKRILPPNTASYFGIESIEGYDPIISSRYEELIAAVARGVPDIKPPFGFNRIVTLESSGGLLLPLLGVRYILSLTDLSQKYLVKVFEEGETRVYEDSRAVPRVYVVERPVKSSGKQESINALYNIKDFRREAVVEGDVSILSFPMNGDESVSLIRYESNRLEIDSSLSVPRLLVVANAYHPGWRASVDGKTTSVYRTNYAFQGIVVPAGTHNVVFSYSLLK